MADEIVRDMRVLKGMRREGLIAFDADTGKIIKRYGRPMKLYYVAGTNGTPDRFTYKGEPYALKYFSGTFAPYVVKVKP